MLLLVSMKIMYMPYSIPITWMWLVMYQDYNLMLVPLAHAIGVINRWEVIFFHAKNKKLREVILQRYQTQQGHARLLLINIQDDQRKAHEMKLLILLHLNQIVVQHDISLQVHIE